MYLLRIIIEKTAFMKYIGTTASAKKAAKTFKNSIWAQNWLEKARRVNPKRIFKGQKKRKERALVTGSTVVWG